MKWDKVRETLIQAVALLSQLVIQLEHMRDFFQIIANSVVVTLATTYNKFRETAQHVLDKSKNPSVGGISLNEYNRTVRYAKRPRRKLFHISSVDPGQALSQRQ